MASRKYPMISMDLSDFWGFELSEFCDSWEITSINPSQTGSIASWFNGHDELEPISWSYRFHRKKGLFFRPKFQDLFPTIHMAKLIYGTFKYLHEFGSWRSPIDWWPLSESRSSLETCPSYTAQERVTRGAGPVIYCGGGYFQWEFQDPN